ncbi:Heavy metal-associated isoprenylated plant protein [Vigna angularis]|uniref:Heavy metal-associated isoprenylated plant protein n=1 Tax=Phaseolus angularis TaxID=3914 RepID=A0A8T0K1D4_PHAAN|nr:Heavy metal-associated isoprenylated plant protein [Vigna angularis]
MEEKTIKIYSSYQKILLVGEGDFSFSLSLAKAFGSGSNMVATSLNSKEYLLEKYSRASSNLKELEDLGCTIIHKVDARTMSEHHLLIDKYFDRIVFNFPLFGIVYHEILVSGFFKNARKMVTQNGEVLVTQKRAQLMKLFSLAFKAKLLFFGSIPFNEEDYPGYVNKKGHGKECDETFPIGDSRTFKFLRDVDFPDLGV